MIQTGGNPSFRRKTCPSATLLTINPTWAGLGSNSHVSEKYVYIYIYILP
jgi:hypothetical protein